MKVTWYESEKKDYSTSVKDINNITIDEINPFFIRFHNFHFSEENTIKTILFNILKHLNRVYMYNSIHAVVREVIQNAVKSNIKRLFFIKKGLDINNNEEYKKGMKIFKDDMDSNIKSYRKKLIDYKKYILLKVSFSKDYLTIGIKNNSSINSHELLRVKSTFDDSEELNSIADLFNYKFDDSEGQGLGLSMVNILLKNENLKPSEVFSIKKEIDSTVAFIRIPLAIKRQQASYQIAKKIVEDIKSLPTFDENIKKIQKMLKDPDMQISRIANEVRKDISITSSLLKLVNSAIYSFHNKIEDVEKAIKVIGLNELSNLLYSVGTKKIMESKYAFFEEVWETSNECAFVSTALLKHKGLDKGLENSLIVSSLLHDIGIVILLSLEEDTVRSVFKIAGIKNQQPDLMLEESVLGLSHTTVGSFIAKKWMFPEDIAYAIEMHHNPDLLNEQDEKYKDIIYCVYMSDRIIDFNQGIGDFDSIYSPVVEYFGFNNDSYREFAKKVKKDYIKHSWANQY